MLSKECRTAVLLLQFYAMRHTTRIVSHLRLAQCIAAQIVFGRICVRVGVFEMFAQRKAQVRAILYESGVIRFVYLH